MDDVGKLKEKVFDAFAGQLPPLHLACQSGRMSEVEYIIGVGYEINKKHNGESAFMYACSFGDTSDFSIIRFLAKNGADINSANKSGESALSMAVCCQRTTLVEELLRLGAEKYTVDGDGENMLHISAGVGNLHLVKLFLSFGLPVNSLNHAGESPIHCALMYRQNLDVFREIVKAGADIKLKSFFGRSPVDLIIKYGDVNAMSTILKMELLSKKRHF